MKNTLNLVLAFCPKDYENTLALVQWIADITPPEDARRFLFVYPKSMGGKPEARIREILEPKGWNGLYFTNPLFDPKGWPQGPNAMFDCAAREMYDVGEFLWLEADAWPTCPQWLSALEADYFAQGKHFYGTKERNDNPDLKFHMNGVAIYPAKLVNHATKYFNQINIPFDLAAADQVIYQMHETKLIQHCWRPQLPFTSLEAVRSEAMLFHQCKDLSVLNLLRTKLDCKNTNAVADSNTSPLVSEELTVLVTAHKRPDKLLKACRSALKIGASVRVVATCAKSKGMPKALEMCKNLGAEVTALVGDPGNNKAWLLAAKEAKTRWCILLHDDDWLESEKFIATWPKIRIALIAGSGWVTWQANCVMENGQIGLHDELVDREGDRSTVPLVKKLMEGTRSPSPGLSCWTKEHLIATFTEWEEHYASNPLTQLSLTMVAGNDLLVYLLGCVSYQKWHKINTPLVNFASWEGSTTVANLAADSPLHRAYATTRKIWGSR